MAKSVQTSVLEPHADPKDPRREGVEPTASRRSPLAVGAMGYAVLTVVLLGVGLLLTHPLSSSIGRWDEHVNDYFAHHRSAGWNDITRIATSAFNTMSVVVAATVVVGLLALRRRWHEAAFLTLALVLEVTVFLSVTFVVARPRPSVVRLNSTPSTSSFPSGHTAAATVLFVGLAIIVMCCTHNRPARAASAFVAGAVVVLVGFARVYRGLHHPTDVISGALLGLSCLLVSALAIRAASRERNASGDSNVVPLDRVADRHARAARTSA